jgi:hypothetical protein
MTKTEKAKELKQKSSHRISVETVLGRIQKGWTDEKILSTPVQKKPPSTHPLKNPSYQAMAKFKGWKT